MFKVTQFSVMVLVAMTSSLLANANTFQNSCSYSFEKAVYNITPTCSLNLFQGETILQFGNVPVDDIERCTADSDMGPMTLNEANELLTELHTKVFAVTGDALINSTLAFDTDSENLRGFVSIDVNGIKDLDSFSVPVTQITGGVLKLGDLEANMKFPYIASFWAEDALEIHLTGTCLGPYFQKGS